MEKLLALSVRQPWAHSIVHAGKDVENRSRSFAHRGWTLIHASAGLTTEEWDTADQFALNRALPRPPAFDELDRGGIVGVARIVDCVTETLSRWWMGPVGLVIDKAHPLPFVPCKGTVAPLFWTPDDETLRELGPALALLPEIDLAAFPIPR